MQSEFQQKLSTLSKACDVTWPEKCKQTSADSSISLVPFVLNIYKKWNIWKLFSEHEILRELVKNCELLLYLFLKVFGCCRRYWRSVSYLPVIGSSSTCLPKYFLGQHRWGLFVDIRQQKQHNTLIWYELFYY